MVSNKFDKSKCDTLNEVYEKTLGKVTPNIFTYNQFLTDSGFTPWTRTYNEMLFYYFRDKPLYSGVSVAYTSENHIFGISFTETFGEELFKNFKYNEYHIDEHFLESIPTMVKVGYIDIPLFHYQEYFKVKYNEEIGSLMEMAQFDYTWFIPVPVVEDEYEYEVAAEVEAEPQPVFTVGVGDVGVNGHYGHYDNMVHDTRRERLLYESANRGYYSDRRELYEEGHRQGLSEDEIMRVMRNVRM